MNFALINLFYTAGLLIGMLISLEVGRRIGRGRAPRAAGIAYRVFIFGCGGPFRCEAAADR